MRVRRCRVAGCCVARAGDARADGCAAGRRLAGRRGRRPASPRARRPGWSRRCCSGTWSAGCARSSIVDRDDADGPVGATSAAVRQPAPAPGRRPPAIPPGAGPPARRDRHGRQRPLGQGPRAAAHGGPRARRGRAVRRRRGRHRDRRHAISAYAFSTENWTRSPDEVRFLMGFNRDVIRRRRDEMHEMGVRVRWAGRGPAAVAQRHQGTRGRRATHPRQRRPDPDHVRELRRPGRDRRRGHGHRARGRGRSARPREGRREDVRAATSTSPTCPTSTCSGGPRASSGCRNFLLWQSAYAELVFVDTLWPDFDRRDLWRACEIYARRDRRFGRA